MRLFYFLAKNISYTFAVSFFTILTGWLITAYGFYLGSSFIIFSYDRLISLIMKWFPMALFFTTILNFFQYGFFTPVKIPAWLKSYRKINSAYKSGFKISVDSMKESYYSISYLPMNNTIAAVIYSILIGILIFGFSAIEYYFFGSITENQLKDIYKILNISTLIVVILNGISTYLLTEIITNTERTRLFNQLILEGHPVKPFAIIGIRLKFLFFVVLMVITLLAFAALMEKSRYSEKYSIENIILYFSVSIFAGFAMMQINSSSILRTLGDLRRVTNVIASGGRAGFKVLSLDKEFSAIEFALMEMAWEIDGHRKNMETQVEQRTIELKTALTDLKEREDQMQKQLDMASVIQRSILASKIDDWNEIKFEVRHSAIEKIGGDFYDVYQLKDGKIGVMISDVSGHGIPAALLTTMAKISFGNACSRNDSPRRIFHEVNRDILNNVKSQDYMTCFMVVIDDDYNITYSNASHQKAIILRTETGKIELLDTNGLFIGAVEEAGDTYEELTTKLNYGDRIILYSDGITEAMNESRVEYSNRRLEQIILESRNLPEDEFADAIMNDVRSFVGMAKESDDITLLVIELARDEAVDIIKQSNRLVSTHKYYEAIELLEEADAKHPENQKILYNLAKNYFRINNFIKSSEIIEKYLKRDKRNKYAYYISGASSYQNRDYKTAVESYEKAVDIDHNFVNAIFALGMCYKKIGDKQKAVSSFERVVNIAPDNKMAMFELKELSKLQ